MSSFVPLPLGRPIPDRPHAVSCSLPTMASVHGYETKDPAVTSRLETGYPRFVVHPFSRRLAARLSERHGLAGRTLWLVSSAAMARALAAHLAAAGSEGRAAATFTADGVNGVVHPDSAELASRAKLFLQHIGGFLSSREAEDRLSALGAESAASAPLAQEPEAEFSGDAAAEIRARLRTVLPGARDEDLLLANCGMNAGYAAFRAVSQLQAERGRTIWIQLGWLYLDTIAILRKFTAAPDDYLYLSDVRDLPALARVLEERGHRVAGVFTEAPTNPLIQTPDLAALGALCHRHGVRLVLDPSVASVFSVDCLAHTDLVVNSLTKYTGSDGDVIAGLIAVNPAGPDAAALRQLAAAALEPIYARDLRRLAAQIGETEAVLARIDANTARVAAFLESHPRVDRVYWALQATSRADYLKIARRPTATGGMISFTLRVPMAPVYDRLRLPKGPSFGMKTTLICPFMYLAHYDLVSTAEGRASLLANGLDPDLLRLCVGIEPVEETIGALAEALAD
jgi:cystathionine gamma-synthase